MFEGGLSRCWEEEAVTKLTLLRFSKVKVNCCNFGQIESLSSNVMDFEPVES